MATSIAHEPLEIGKNYESWRSCMESYLISQDLWNVVADNAALTTPEENEAFKKKDAAALRAIKFSCSPDTFAEIRQETSAEAAWNTLAYLNEMWQWARGREQPRDIDDEKVKRDQVLTLFNAIKESNLGTIKDLLEKDPDLLINTKLFSDGTNALRLAASCNQHEVVHELVGKMELVSVEKVQPAINTAAFNGAYGIVNELIRRIPNDYLAGETLKSACFGCQKEMICGNLYPQIRGRISREVDVTHDTVWFMIHLKLFDVAFDLTHRYPNIIFHILGILDAEVCCKRLGFWERWICSCLPPVILRRYDEEGYFGITMDGERFDWQGGLPLLLKFPGIFKQIYGLKVTHVCVQRLFQLLSNTMATLGNEEIRYRKIDKAIFNAAKLGAVELIEELIRKNPDLLYWLDDDKRSIFHIAILHRQEKVFSLIYRIGTLKNDILQTVDEYNILHLAGESPPQRLVDEIQGPVLLMQRELQWFKEVETIVPMSFRLYRNSETKTASQVFEENHRDLVEQGQKWMKDISQSSTIVGTLIITIMFAAHFTVPGGCNQETGIPLFLARKAFKVFVISDSISLSASSTSVLIFLNLLTSRYAPKDFLKVLPTKLTFALLFLFISIATMMIAFSSAVFLLLKGKLSFVIPIIVLVSIPVIVFMFSQLHLLKTTFWSTWGPAIFDRNGTTIVDRGRNRGEQRQERIFEAHP